MRARRDPVIVSAGGVEFMRVFAERVYGIPPEQVIGSSGVVRLAVGTDGKPVLMKEPKVDFINDGAGKPVVINHFIGRQPILAFGNPMAIYKCWSGLRPAAGQASWAWCSTPTQNASGPATASRT